MDLMDVRREMMGVIARMAGGATLLHGEFTPTTNETTHTIDVGKDISILIVQLKEYVLYSGERNWPFAMCRVENGQVVETYGVAGNATGTSMMNNGAWSQSPSQPGAINMFSKSGTSYTVTPSSIANGAKFFANTTYEWYAI